MSEGTPQDNKRPGRNGGLLNTGNIIGVDRRSNEVRARALQGADSAIDWLCQVSQGRAVWPYIDKDGTRRLRKPTGDEMLGASEKLLKYGLGTQRELTGKDGADLIPTPKPHPTIDWSKLSMEEREQALALAEKARVDAP